MSEPLLRVRNLECSYGPVVAIRGVSLDVPEGSIVAVLGANGAGKTTLLKTISGVMDPAKGSIDLTGASIARADPDRIVRRGVVHVPEGREMFPMLSVGENLAMGAYTRRDGGVGRDREMVFEYFPILAERLRQSAGTLSGGEQQMLAIGRALMAEPKLLMIDEVSLGLMPAVIDVCYAALGRLRDDGLAILLVEQSTQRAFDIADAVCVLESGKAVWTGSAEAAREDPALVEAYLGLAG